MYWRHVRAQVIYSIEGMTNDCQCNVINGESMSNLMCNVRIHNKINQK